MTITLKLFASLAAYQPPGARGAGDGLPLQVEAGSTVLDVIRHRRIPEALCAIVLVDGNWVGRPERASRELRDGEVLAIWPPVAGGGPAFTRTLEMSVTPEEFLRLFRAVVPRFDVGEDATVRWNDDAWRGMVRLRPADPVHARGSSLGLPLHRVEVALEGSSEAEGEAFMARFHRAFLRGGG